MNKTAIIVVDMIYDFTNPHGKIFYPINSSLISKIHDFVEEARQYGCLIIYVAHTVQANDLAKRIKPTRECCIEGTGGELIDERLHVDIQQDIIIKKTKYSAFFDTSLRSTLTKYAIDQIVVVGTKTNNCILATVIDAYNYNIKTFVPRELVGTNDEITNVIYLRDMDKYLCEVESETTILDKIKRGIL